MSLILSKGMRNLIRLCSSKVSRSVTGARSSMISMETNIIGYCFIMDSNAWMTYWAKCLTKGSSKRNTFPVQGMWSGGVFEYLAATLVTAANFNRNCRFMLGLHYWLWIWLFRWVSDGMIDDYQVNFLPPVQERHTIHVVDLFLHFLLWYKKSQCLVTK